MANVAIFTTVHFIGRLLIYLYFFLLNPGVFFVFANLDCG